MGRLVHADGSRGPLYIRRLAINHRKNVLIRGVTSTYSVVYYVRATRTCFPVRRVQPVKASSQTRLTATSV